MKTKTIGLALALAMVAGTASAQAVRGNQAGDVVLGAGLIGVLPSNGGNTSIGGEPQASDSYTLQLDLSYFFTPNIALNIIAATTRHDVEVRNVPNVGTIDLGRVWALPPTLTLQYYPLPASRFSPYVGAALNYTVFYGEGGSRSAGINKVEIDNAFGYGVNFGFNYEITPAWLFNFDVKRLWLRPDVSVNSGGVTAEAHIDPWIVGASIRFRF
jgi:outer membrane protein